MSGGERVFAVRGAVQAERNDRESILAAADELIRELMRAQRARSRSG